MRGLPKLMWIEMKLFLREPLASFFTLAFPIILLLLFGSIFGNAPIPAYKGFGFVDVSVPAYAAMVIGTGAILSLGTSLATYREKGVLRRLQMTPLYPIAILIAQVVVIFSMTTVGLILLVVVGKVGFGLRCGGNAAIIFAAFVLCSMCMAALGFVLASLVRTVRGAQAIGMAIFYPMIFLSGAAIPRDLLPHGVQRAAVVLPLTHVVTLLQGLWMGESWMGHLEETGILLGFMAAGVAISVRTFRWE